MKWFKHDTDCDESEGLAFLVEQEGFAGYGRWFRLLEIVASKMDKTERCSVEYPTKKWCSLLGLKQKKLKTFLELTENKLKTKVVYSENIIIISIPNLLNKRDDYSRKSEQCQDKVTPRSKIVEVDTDKEEDSTEKKTCSDMHGFLMEWYWENYPHRGGIRIGKKPTSDNLKKYVKLDEFDSFQKAVENFKRSKGVSEGFGVPDPERFIYSAKKKYEPWREWVSIETVYKKGDPGMTSSHKDPGL